MSKGQDKKKETKKPATKTLKEKRAEKKAKKDGKQSLLCSSIIPLKGVNHIDDYTPFNLKINQWRI